MNPPPPPFWGNMWCICFIRITTPIQWCGMGLARGSIHWHMVWRNIWLTIRRWTHMCIRPFIIPCVWRVMHLFSVFVWYWWCVVIALARNSTAFGFLHQTHILYTDHQYHCLYTKQSWPQRRDRWDTDTIPTKWVLKFFALMYYSMGPSDARAFRCLISLHIQNRLNTI